MDNSFEGISKSSRLGDGAPTQGGLYDGARLGSHHEGEHRRRLLSGKDAAEFGPLVAFVYKTIRESILSSIREAFALELAPDPWPSSDPGAELERHAELLFAGVGKLLHLAREAGVPEPEAALLAGSEAGIARAMGHIESLGDEAVAHAVALLELWADLLLRLVPRD